MFCSQQRHRAEFLAHLKSHESQNSAASGPDSGNWTLVDEGGEEVSVAKKTTSSRGDSQAFKKIECDDKNESQNNFILNHQETLSHICHSCNLATKYMIMKWCLSKLLSTSMHFLVHRTRTQRAAGCCCVRRIWSPCSPSFHSSSCIHTCWGLTCRVRVSTSARPFLLHLFQSLTVLTSFHLPARRVWVPDPIKSEDHACFWLCLLSRWNSGTGAADLQQGTVPTVSETDWTHHKVSEPSGKRTFTQIMNQSLKAFIMSCSPLRMTVCYVSDHWAEYVSVAGADGSSSHSLSLDKLQQEYDHLFLRAVLHVLKNKR